MLRVVAGIAKGHKLKTPSGNNTRPTTDRVKESLFNIINFKIPDSVVLDLFAGSGSLGIEALSRGAKFAVFSDFNRESIKIINENISHTKFKEKSLVLCKKSDITLKIMAQEKRTFNIIFLDPPYSVGILQNTLNEIGELDILEDDGIVVVERNKGDLISETYGNLHLYRDQKYGETILSFFEKSTRVE